MIRRVLFSVAMALLAGRLLGDESQVPAAAQISTCSADAVEPTSAGHFSDLHVTCAEIEEFLAQAQVVSESQWLHEYSHVAFADRTGQLTLRDGTKLRWMVRPGGLGYLEFADGRKVYLVRCCLNQSSNYTAAQPRIPS